MTEKKDLIEAYASCMAVSRNSSLRTYDLVEKDENDFFKEIANEGYDIKAVYNVLLESGELSDEEVSKVSVAYSNFKKKLDEAEQLDEINLKALHTAWKKTQKTSPSGWSSPNRTKFSDALWQASTDIGHLGPIAGIGAAMTGAALGSPGLALAGAAAIPGTMATGVALKGAELTARGVKRLANIRREYKKLKEDNEIEICNDVIEALNETFDIKDVEYILEGDDDLMESFFGKKGLRNPSIKQLKKEADRVDLAGGLTTISPYYDTPEAFWSRAGKRKRYDDIIKKKTAKENKVTESEEQLDEIDHSLPREQRLKILAQKVDRHVSNQWERGHKVLQRGWKENARVLAPINAKYADWWEEPRGSGKHVGQLKDQNGDRGETVPLTDDEHKILSKFVKTSEKYKKLTRPLYWSSTRWSGAQDQLDPKNHQYEPGDIMNQPKNWPKHDDRVGGMHKYLGANRGAPRGDYHYPDGAKYNPQTDKMDRDGAGVPKGKIYKGSILDRVKHALKKKY